jgi:hypothetical protein
VGVPVVGVGVGAAGRCVCSVLEAPISLPPFFFGSVKSGVPVIVTALLPAPNTMLPKVPFKAVVDPTAKGVPRYP